MDFVFDFSFLSQLGNKSPLFIMWDLFLYGGWIVIAVVLVWGFWQIFLSTAAGKFASGVKHHLLAVDIPKENLTTPRAVENLFSQFAGAHGSLTWWESNIEGKFQLAITLEIVSVEGYIQFLIHTPAKYKDLVEASIYAQYPDAEITEVEDYTKEAPDHFPSDEYDMFGAELVQVTNEVYPIRTYKDFEDEFSGDFTDPMAALLETMSKAGPGEHVWYQLVLTPISDSWKKGAQAQIDEVLGKKPKPKKSLLESILTFPITIITMVLSGMFGGEGSDAPAREEKNGLSMMELTPGQKETIEAIERKTSKIGFKTKIRFIYWAKKESMNKGKIANTFIGAIKQFNTANLNAIKPAMKETGSTAHYLFIKTRIARKQRRLMQAYKGRSQSRGKLGTGEGAMKGSVYNIEELATLWHFPISTVKAPLLKKTEARRAEPPSGLPIGVTIEDAGPSPTSQSVEQEQTEQTPEESFTFDYTDKGFEQRFAKNKELYKQAPTTKEPNKETKQESSDDDVPDNLPVS